MYLPLARFFLNALFIVAFTSGISHAQVVNIEDSRLRVADTLKWAGNINFGLNMIQNTNQFITANSNANISYKNNKHFLMSLSSYNFAQFQNRGLLNDGLQHIRYNFDIQPKVVLEAYAQGQFNAQILLTQRWLLGTGVRFKLFKTKFSRAYLGTSYFYEKTQFSNLSEPFYNHRISSYFSFSIRKAAFRFSSTSYYQPIASALNTARFSSDNVLVFPISKKFSYRTNFNLFYDNDKRIPTEVPNLIYQWTNGFGIIL
jgi:hypothetical protein